MDKPEHSKSIILSLRSRLWQMVGIVAAGALAIALLAQSALAQQAVDAAVEAIGAFSSGPSTNVFKRTQDSPAVTSSTSFTTLAGTTVRFTVPAGQTRLVNARFSAESQCRELVDVVFPSWCSVRILVDGVEMNPQSGLDFAFDSADGGLGSWESHAMERTARVGAGTHTLVVQWATIGGVANVEFRLDDWLLSVELHQP